ncbi:MAG: 50S ribosomal protein L16 [Nanoarchaeota archaeon]
MAGLRPAHCYTEIKRAYTRKSKFKSKGYVKAAPNSKIVKYFFGDVTKNFSHQLDFVAIVPVQIRHNALESVRQIVNRRLSIDIGKNYRLIIRGHPHHVLREHKMLTGAGADRMSPGMAHAFGRPIGLAVQAKRGKVLMSIWVDKSDIEKAKYAYSKAFPRLPGRWNVVVTDIVKIPEITSFPSR